MPKSNTSHSDPTVTSATKSKKTVPINHVILKRIGDLKTLVSDLVVSSDDKAIASLDLGDEIQKQASEIEALKCELQKFQSGILSSFCDALDQRLNQPAPTSHPPATAEQAAETQIHSVQDAGTTNTLPKNFSPIGIPVAAFRKESAANDRETSATQGDCQQGLKEETWESIRSAFLNEHEINEQPEPRTASQPDESASIDLNEAKQAASVDQHGVNEDCPTHIDNVEDTEDDLDFKHSDIIADLDSLDQATLRSVVEKQEQLILGLIRRLRTRYNNRPTMTIDQLQSVQDLAHDELATEIRGTLAVLHNQQRQGELELSLERAKLSRRRTELEQLEARIDGRARTLGVTINAEGSLEDGPVADRGTGTKSRRWLGALGFGNS